MKILDITLKNLNSLRGKWTINFADPAYKSDGIFAVTGPTGSGKTTIFDAICLALYGRTPRLNSHHKSEIAEIMSKHTKKCMAKVTFEAGGKIFVCEWSLTKTKDKNGEDRFDTEHTIIEDSRKTYSGTSARVAEITGLDFRRFTQAMLLAQGDFDAFLKGNTPERAKILELLTGSEKYGEISKSIAEHADKAKQALDEIRMKRDAMTPHDNFGTDDEISQGITEKRTKISGLKIECTELETAVLWLKRLRDIRDEISQNASKIDSIKKIIEAFTEKRTRLEAGIRARDILPIHAELLEKRKYHSDMKKQYEDSKREVEESNKKLDRIESKLLPEYEDKLRLITCNIPEGESPASIREKVRADIEESVRIYRQKAEIESKKSKAEEKLKKLQAVLDSAKEEETTARMNLERSRARVSELMNIRVSATINDKRKELKPGDICPLCGSVVQSDGLHSAGGNATNSDFRFDDELEAARKSENDALKKSQEAGERLSLAQSDRDSCSTSIEHYRKNIFDCEERRLAIKSSILEIIEPIGIIGAKSCDEITGRVGTWYSEAVSLDKKIVDLRGEVQSLRGSAETQKKSLADRSSLLEANAAELEALEKVFREALAEKKFADEKQFTASKLTDAKMSELQQEAQNYDNEMTRLQAVRDNMIKQLEEEEAKAVTAMKLKEAEPLFARKKEEIDTLKGELSRLEVAEESRRKLKSERDKLNEEYRVQEEIYSKWKLFDDELGQKNGGAFRKFAQRITLRMLVQLANAQLEKINSRYTLVSTPKEKDELCLSVKDSEQAGEIRPTSNLSGGERFIISLALALGLSQISGSKAQVDSLFIDEGFGSLDEEALNAALEALGEIHRKGRMIGIISHVSGISERIRAKINVIRKSEGTSIIKGPGCSGGI